MGAGVGAASAPKSVETGKDKKKSLWLGAGISMRYAQKKGGVMTDHPSWQLYAGGNSKLVTRSYLPELLGLTHEAVKEDAAKLHLFKHLVTQQDLIKANNEVQKPIHEQTVRPPLLSLVVFSCCFCCSLVLECLGDGAVAPVCGEGARRVGEQSDGLLQVAGLAAARQHATRQHAAGPAARGRERVPGSGRRSTGGVGGVGGNSTTRTCARAVGTQHGAAAGAPVSGDVVRAAGVLRSCWAASARPSGAIPSHPRLRLPWLRFFFLRPGRGLVPMLFCWVRQVFVSARIHRRSCQ